MLTDNTKLQVKTFLDNPDVTDGALIETLNEAANFEPERLLHTEVKQ